MTVFPAERPGGARWEYLIIETTLLELEPQLGISRAWMGIEEADIACACKRKMLVAGGHDHLCTLNCLSH